MTWGDIIKQLLKNERLANNYKRVAFDRTRNRVYPAHEDVFRAFSLCPIEKTKVVIIGQDPYPQKDVADGLAFSTKQEGTPASLSIIFNEIKRTFPEALFENNSLDWWAKQGVLLLNTSLTVIHNTPASHAALWKLFTLAIVKALNNSDKRIVWMLWGSHARDYKHVLTNADQSKLEACHPAAESRGSGEFTGCNHFIDANNYLKAVSRGTIDWNTYVKEPYPETWNT